MADGSAFVGAYLPLVVSSGGVETCARVARARLAGAARRSTTPSATTLDARSPPWRRVAVDRARLASTAAERSEWFERMAHTDPLTGLANERTVGRILELELARAGRQGSEVSFAMFDVDDFQADQPARAATRPATTSSAGSRRSSPSRSGWWTRSGGSVATSSSSSRRDRPGLTVAQRILEGIAALPAVAGRPITVSAGVARFPVDGHDAAALIAAATAALDRARAEGRGTVGSGIVQEG